MTPETRAVLVMREAIQECEELGLVRTESGQVITGAVISENGIVLVESGEENEG